MLTSISVADFSRHDAREQSHSLDQVHACAESALKANKLKYNGLIEILAFYQEQLCGEGFVDSRRRTILHIYCGNCGKGRRLGREMSFALVYKKQGSENCHGRY